jgi:hypothetical protein
MHSTVTINLPTINDDATLPDMQMVNVGILMKFCMSKTITGIIIELHHDVFTTEKPEVYTMGNQLCVHSSVLTAVNKRGDKRSLCDVAFIDQGTFDLAGYTVLEQMYPKTPSASLFIFVPFNENISSEDKPTANQTDKRVAVADETKVTESEESARKTCEELYIKKEEIERMLADVDNRIHVARKRFLEFILS